MINSGPSIITNGLVFYIDMADKKSYAGSGASIFDRSGFRKIGTLSSGIYSFNASGGTGYSNGTISTTGGGGVGFAASYTTTSGSITGFTVTNAGYGYTSVPTFVASSGGSGATITGALNLADFNSTLKGYLTFSSTAINNGCSFTPSTSLFNPNTDNWTISCFANITTASVTNALIDLIGGSGTLSIRASSTSNSYYVYSGTTPDLVASATNAFTIGRWHQVTIRKEGYTGNGNIGIYVNGIYLSSLSLTATLQTATGKINLAFYEKGTTFLDCSIANALVYNRALSEDEILQNYLNIHKRFNL